MSLESNTSQSLDMVGVTGSIPVAPTKEQILAEAFPQTGQQLASESDPPEIDAEGLAEFKAISNMLTSAAEYSLEVEVVHSFGVYRMSGSDVQTACREALYEWDI